MIVVHVHTAWLAYGIEAQRLPSGIGSEHWKDPAHERLACLRSSRTSGEKIGILSNKGRRIIIRIRLWARPVEAYSRASAMAYRKTQMNALLVLSLLEGPGMCT